MKNIIKQISPAIAGIIAGCAALAVSIHTRMSAPAVAALDMKKVVSQVQSANPGADVKVLAQSVQQAAHAYAAGKNLLLLNKAVVLAGDAPDVTDDFLHDLLRG